MNKKLIKTLICITSSIGIFSCISNFSTSCSNSTNQEYLPYDVLRYDFKSEIVVLLNGFMIESATSKDWDKYKKYHTLRIPSKFDYEFFQWKYPLPVYLDDFSEDSMPNFITKIDFEKGSKITVLESSSGLFGKSAYVNEIKLPEKLLSVGYYALQLPNLKKIDFSDCEDLQEISPIIFGDSQISYIPKIEEVNFGPNRHINNFGFATNIKGNVVVQKNDDGKFIFDGTNAIGELSYGDVTFNENTNFDSGQFSGSSFTSITLSGENNKFENGTFRNSRNLSKIFWNNLNNVPTNFGTQTFADLPETGYLYCNKQSIATNLLAKLKEAGLPEGWQLGTN